jgi:hypothetical protein
VLRCSTRVFYFATATRWQKEAEPSALRGFVLLRKGLRPPWPFAPWP